jgi:hypothetical protein
MRRPAVLEEDLRGDVRGAAAAAEQFDGLMKVGVALRDPLRERGWIPGLHQHVEPPALDFPAFVRFSFEERQLVHLA